MAELAARVRELQARGQLCMPLPGRGETPARHRSLLNLGRVDLSIARIAEAHTDALAILAEADRTERYAGLYGVWASDGPQGKLLAERVAQGWRLHGLKQYCSGATFLEAALVTAHDGDGLYLFEVSLKDPAVKPLPGTWASSAFADTATDPVSFESLFVTDAALVGDKDWYLTRSGFWHGAVGPAACWAGGACALIDAAAGLKKSDSHYRAQMGAMQSVGWGFDAVLCQAGREIDADPEDAGRGGRSRALQARHLIERWCTEILDRFGRATGPQLLAYDAQAARQYAALALYIRQCHAERDLESIWTP